MIESILIIGKRKLYLLTNILDNLGMLYLLLIIHYMNYYVNYTQFRITVTYKFDLLIYTFYYIKHIWTDKTVPSLYLYHSRCMWSTRRVLERPIEKVSRACKRLDSPLTARGAPIESKHLI